MVVVGCKDSEYDLDIRIGRENQDSPRCQGVLPLNFRRRIQPSNMDPTFPFPPTTLILPQFQQQHSSTPPSFVANDTFSIYDENLCPPYDE